MKVGTIFLFSRFIAWPAYLNYSFICVQLINKIFKKTCVIKCRSGVKKLFNQCKKTLSSHWYRAEKVEILASNLVTNLIAKVVFCILRCFGLQTALKDRSGHHRANIWAFDVRENRSRTAQKGQINLFCLLVLKVREKNRFKNVGSCSYR